MNAYYQADLAYVHDTEYSQLATAAAHTIVDLLNEKEPAAQRVVDLGCGSGVLAAQLAAHGIEVVGVDTSADMLALARVKSPQSTFVQASLFDVELPACTLVCSVGECLCYLFDEKSTVPALLQLFAKVYAALRPGGYFLFDILTPYVLPQQRWSENELWSLYVEVSIEEQRNILTRDIYLFRKEGEVYRRSRETHRQQLYHSAEIEQILLDCGFAVSIINHYHHQAFRQGHIGFLCTKYVEPVMAF